MFLDQRQKQEDPKVHMVGSPKIWVRLYVVVVISYTQPYL